MSITTKSGDFGKTDLIGERVSKSDIRIELIGTIDELIATLSVALSFNEIKNMEDEIHYCQNSLFTLNGQLAGAQMRDMSIFTHHFEDFISEYEEKIGNFSFCFTSKKSSSFLDVSRSIARRAERIFYRMNYDRKDIAAYLNRISDYLYIMSRFSETEEA